MIRRGFWLVTGAVLGVAGYRKATRLARTVTGQALLGGSAGTRGRAPIGRAPIARSVLQLPASAQPARTRPADRSGQAGSTMQSNHGAQAEPGLARPAQPDPHRADRIAAAAARAAAAAGFVRDMREGMAEYWDLHRGESDRTLGS